MNDPELYAAVCIPEQRSDSNEEKIPPSLPVRTARPPKIPGQRTS
jgi:hypothetical protein